MRLLASLGARERCRTLVAQDGAVWIWPGISLTLRRGAEIVPVSNEIVRFWITRLHGPEALYKDLSSAVSRAASRPNIRAGRRALRTVRVGASLLQMAQALRSYLLRPDPPGIGHNGRQLSKNRRTFLKINHQRMSVANGSRILEPGWRTQ